MIARVPSSVSRLLLVLGAGASLSACATEPPTGPRIVAMPATGESFAVFQQHDATCRDFAAGRTNPSALQKPGAAVAGAAAGAGLGAAAGALIGSANGHAGGGAAIGAGSGLLLGSALGLGRQRREETAVQQRYDAAYAQCMAANGERLPSPPSRPVIYAAPPVVWGPPPAVIYSPVPVAPPPSSAPPAG